MFIADFMKIRQLTQKLVLFAKYNYNDEVKENEMGRACRTHGAENEYRVLLGKLEGKRPLGRPRHRWEDGIRWILERWDGVVWT
jgi:hypothetical protein